MYRELSMQGEQQCTLWSWEEFFAKYTRQKDINNTTLRKATIPIIEYNRTRTKLATGLDNSQRTFKGDRAERVTCVPCSSGFWLVGNTNTLIILKSLNNMISNTQREHSDVWRFVYESRVKINGASMSCRTVSYFVFQFIILSNCKLIQLHSLKVAQAQGQAFWIYLIHAQRLSSLSCISEDSSQLINPLLSLAQLFFNQCNFFFSWKFAILEILLYESFL